jgi:nucleoside-diphosphate-sugar epimerase
MLLVLGLGYTSSAFVDAAEKLFPRVLGTRRVAQPGAIAFDGTVLRPELEAAMADATTLLISIPPDQRGDPFLACLAGSSLPRLQQVLYLSTIGVYGDQAGAWIDEGSLVRGAAERNHWRLKAEAQWLAFGAAQGAKAQVFRLGGIYGPGRNPLIDLASGTAKRIEKPGQVFNRIHVDDIARTLVAALERGEAGAIYNVVDDEPAPPQDVVAYAAALCGAPVPPLVSYDQAEMSPMARTFYADSRRVSNRRIRRVLGVELGSPTYREGLQALFAAGEYSATIPSLRARDRRI